MKVKDFNKYANEIEKEAKEAEENLGYLKHLTEPCQRLSEANPVEIPEIIPDLLIRIRMIWDKCPYY